MLIGLDFDNTIVSYDALFYKVAIEQKVVPASLPVNKVAVRDHLRSNNKEDIWTEMQGYVYGKRMNEAQAYKGVIEFIIKAKQLGHSLCIISHKTRHPFLGPQHDLHKAAIGWINKYLMINGSALFSEYDYFFELTKDDKVKQINNCGCDIYVDDLPEILENPFFPKNCTKILFDPEKYHSKGLLTNIKVKNSWKQIEQEIL